MWIVSVEGLDVAFDVTSYPFFRFFNSLRMLGIGIIYFPLGLMLGKMFLDWF